MLKITTRNEPEGIILELEGKLVGSWVCELEACWKKVLISDQAVTVSLKAVTFIDRAGVELLNRMHKGGVTLVGEGCMNTAIIAEIYQQREHE